MDEEKIIELCHQVMRENPSAVLLVRSYPTGFLQLTDALKKLAPDIPYEVRADHLYRLCVPGFWAADKSAQAIRDNPNITGPELAEVLRKSIPDECEHQQLFGNCPACGDQTVMFGLDISGWSFAENIRFRALVQKLVETLEHTDHTPGTSCLRCEAEEALPRIEGGEVTTSLSL